MVARQIDYIMIVNLVSNFFRAYLNSQGSLVYTLSHIRAHYLSNAFVFDLLPCLPIQQVGIRAPLEVGGCIFTSRCLRKALATFLCCCCGTLNFYIRCGILIDHAKLEARVQLVGNM